MRLKIKVLTVEDDDGRGMQHVALKTDPINRLVPKPNGCHQLDCWVEELKLKKADRARDALYLDPWKLSFYVWENKR